MAFIKGFFVFGICGNLLFSIACQYLKDGFSVQNGSLGDTKSMAKYCTLFSFILMSGATFSSMSYREVKRELASMIGLVKSEFLGTDEFRIFGGDFIVSPKIVVNNDESVFPNANLTPLDDYHMGVMVNQALLALDDDTAILFALAHELGHGYSAELLDEINCSQIGGKATEVVADLGAVRLLNAKGLSLNTIKDSVSQWENTKIFDVAVSGDHPAGAERYKWIAMAIASCKSGINFIDVVNYIVRIELGAPCSGVWSRK